MSVGKITEFQLNSGMWSCYSDRLEMYFMVNRIGDDMKLPTLIAVMGDETYELLVNLASPRKPSELTYNEASELLRNHLQPSPSVLAERYRFRQTRQRSEQNVNEFVAELKKLARFCNFNNGLAENLRDQFVCGLKDDIMRQRLFGEDEGLTFINAVKIANSLEAAERDAAAVQARSVPDAAESVGKVHAMQARGGRRVGRALFQRGPSTDLGKYANCKGCGATSHDYASCFFRDYQCSRCGRMGHLRRVCSNLGNSQSGGKPGSFAGRGFHFGTSEEGKDESKEEDSIDLHALCLTDYKVMSLPISIDKKILNMEIDTGTPISCISKDTYDRYFKYHKLRTYNLTLKFYNGTNVRPLGFIKPLVKYEGVVKYLELFVIKGGTTSLLGRQWLTELNIPIGNTSNCNRIDSVCSNIDMLLDRYKQLFDGTLGRFTGGKATLRVREGAAPVFHRARPLPFALRERMDKELDVMLGAGIIEPVDCSDWASPLVPVNKPDGTLRVCVDYKATLNPVLLVDRYPLPKFDDILFALNGAQFFSKIDLSQAYNQIELDESKKFTVVNTHRGLFCYNRLVFGLSSSPSIFQRLMTNLFRGIPNVAVFIDDVIVGGKTKTEHLETLQLVFQRLLDNGLRLKKSKCIFLVREVTYLGYIVSKDGVKADPAKIEAIKNIPKPQNISELRSFLGMVNFFAKFLNNFSQRLIPLYNLLKKGVKWYWSQDCDRVFESIKNELVGSEVLAHYDPSKPLIVTSDASAVGVGGVLSQPSSMGGVERPIAFVSRTLTSAEKNYSQIHREALAIVFCLKKFHQYVYGRRFTLRTDHKPLVSIFGPNNGIPVMTASRMQRWAIILSAYTYDIEYVRTSDNSADGLSRLPLPCDRISGMPEQTHLHFAQEALLLDYQEIKRHTATDPILGRLLTYIRDGWPVECDTAGMQPYFNRKQEMYEELGCVMWGHRVVVPERCRDKVLQIIHEPHMGIVKSKALARSYVWWAGIDEAVEAVCRACTVCAAHADAPPRQSPRPWPWPHRPWTRIHLDFMGPIFGKTYLVVVDAMSKWIEVFNVHNTTAAATIERLSELWSRWGIPRQVVTDNGPPFTSQDFAEFLRCDMVEHLFSPPYHPSSNGAAENAVKTLKRVIKKAQYENQNIMKALNRFLLYYRNTEHASTGETPALLLLGRRLRTRLDSLRPDRDARMKQIQQRQINNAAGAANRSVGPGEEVWYRQYLKGEKWLPGTVEKSLGQSNYKVVSEDGSLVHRHIDQLKRRSRRSLVYTNPDAITSESRSPSFLPELQDKDFDSSDSFVDAESGTAKSEQPQCLSPEISLKSEPCDRTTNEGNVGLEFRESIQDLSSTSKPGSRPIRQCRLRKKPLYF